MNHATFRLMPDLDDEAVERLRAEVREYMRVNRPLIFGPDVTGEIMTQAESDRRLLCSLLGIDA